MRKLYLVLIFAIGLLILPSQVEARCWCSNGGEFNESTAIPKETCDSTGLEKKCWCTREGNTTQNSNGTDEGSCDSLRWIPGIGTCEWKINEPPVCKWIEEPDAPEPLTTKTCWCVDGSQQIIQSNEVCPVNCPDSQSSYDVNAALNQRNQANNPSATGPAAAAATATKEPVKPNNSLLPDCLFYGQEFTDQCKSINTFVEFGIKLGAFAFSIVGALALGALIYGGFMLVISGGNSERMSKGWGAIFAAAIGLAITFSGYVLVQFIISAIGANSDWSLIKSVINK